MVLVVIPLSIVETPLSINKMHETSSFTLFYFLTKATCIKTNIHREVLFLQTDTSGNSVQNVGGFYAEREAKV